VPDAGFKVDHGTAKPSHGHEQENIWGIKVGGAIGGRCSGAMSLRATDIRTLDIDSIICIPPGVLLLEFYGFVNLERIP